MSLDRSIKEQLKTVLCHAIATGESKDLTKFLDERDISPNVVLENGETLFQFVLKSCNTASDPAIKIALCFLEQGGTNFNRADLGFTACYWLKTLIKDVSVLGRIIGKKEDEAKKAQEHSECSHRIAYAYRQLGDEVVARKCFKNVITACTTIKTEDNEERVISAEWYVEYLLKKENHAAAIDWLLKLYKNDRDGFNKNKFLVYFEAIIPVTRSRYVYNKTLELLHAVGVIDKELLESKAENTVFNSFNTFAKNLLEKENSPHVKKVLTVYREKGSLHQKLYVAAAEFKLSGGVVKALALVNHATDHYEKTREPSLLANAKETIKSLNLSFEEQAVAYHILMNNCFIILTKDPQKPAAIKQVLLDVSSTILNDDIYKRLDFWQRGTLTDAILLLDEDQKNNLLYLQYQREIGLDHFCTMLINKIISELCTNKYFDDEEKLKEVIVILFELYQKTDREVLQKMIVDLINNLIEIARGKGNSQVCKLYQLVQDNGCIAPLSVDHREPILRKFSECGDEIYIKIALYAMVEKRFTLNASYLSKCIEKLKNFPQYCENFYLALLHVFLTTHSEDQKKIYAEKLAQLAQIIESPEYRNKIQELLIHYYTNKDLPRAVAVASTLDFTTAAPEMKTACGELFKLYASQAQKDEKAIAGYYQKSAELGNLESRLFILAEEKNLVDKLAKLKTLILDAMSASNIKVALKALDEVLEYKKKFIISGVVDQSESQVTTLCNEAVMLVYQPQNIKAHPWQLLRFAKESLTFKSIQDAQIDKNVFKVVQDNLRQIFVNNIEFSIYVEDIVTAGHGSRSEAVELRNLELQFSSVSEILRALGKLLQTPGFTPFCSQYLMIRQKFVEKFSVQDDSARINQLFTLPFTSGNLLLLKEIVVELVKKIKKMDSTSATHWALSRIYILALNYKSLNIDIDENEFIDMLTKISDFEGGYLNRWYSAELYQHLLQFASHKDPFLRQKAENALCTVSHFAFGTVLSDVNPLQLRAEFRFAIHAAVKKEISFWGTDDSNAITLCALFHLGNINQPLPSERKKRDERLQLNIKVGTYFKKKATSGNHGALVVRYQEIITEAENQNKTILHPIHYLMQKLKDDAVFYDAYISSLHLLLKLEDDPRSFVTDVGYNTGDGFKWSLWIELIRKRAVAKLADMQNKEIGALEYKSPGVMDFKVGVLEATESNTTEFKETESKATEFKATKSKATESKTTESKTVASSISQSNGAPVPINLVPPASAPSGEVVEAGDIIKGIQASVVDAVKPPSFAPSFISAVSSAQVQISADASVPTPIVPTVIDDIYDNEPQIEGTPNVAILSQVIVKTPSRNNVDVLSVANTPEALTDEPQPGATRHQLADEMLSRSLVFQEPVTKQVVQDSKRSTPSVLATSLFSQSNQGQRQAMPAVNQSAQLVVGERKSQSLFSADHARAVQVGESPVKALSVSENAEIISIELIMINFEYKGKVPAYRLLETLKARIQRPLRCHPEADITIVLATDPPREKVMVKVQCSSLNCEGELQEIINCIMPPGALQLEGRMDSTLPSLSSVRLT